jgi:hypothetical protein
VARARPDEASGGEAVRRFYSRDFVGQTPVDAELRLIAGTVAEDV